MSFQGKNALITGSSRGIGRGIALKLAEQGARVAVHYHQNREAAEATLEKSDGSGRMDFSCKQTCASQTRSARCFKVFARNLDGSIFL